MNNKQEYRVIDIEQFRKASDKSFVVKWKFNTEHPRAEWAGELKYFPHKEIMYSTDQVLDEVKKACEDGAVKISIVGRESRTRWQIKDNFEIREYLDKVDPKHASFSI